MLRTSILLFIAALLVASNSQCTAFQSTLNNMVTGVAELGNPTDTFAKEDYSVVFSSNDNLGLYANIFSAFCNPLILSKPSSDFKLQVDRTFTQWSLIKWSSQIITES